VTHLVESSLETVRAPAWSDLDPERDSDDDSFINDWSDAGWDYA
jgi:hypothetical protein